MSENCFIMPFRFTIITAARTAWGRRNGIRMAEKFLEATGLPHAGMTHPDLPSTWQGPAYNQLPPYQPYPLGAD